jgi:hypothetical protein
MSKEKLTSSPKQKKDSSDFSFSYDRKINFMVVKIYFMPMCHNLAQANALFA